MEKILPVVIFCGVGIALCVVALVIIFVKGIKNKFKHRHCEQFEIDDDTITVSLSKKDLRK